MMNFPSFGPKFQNSIKVKTLSSTKLDLIRSNQKVCLCSVFSLVYCVFASVKTYIVSE